MNKSDIEVLSESEIETLAEAYLSIIKHSEHIPSMKRECNAAKRSLFKLFSFVKESITEYKIRVDREYIVYPVITKKVGNLKYDSNGYIKDDNYYHSYYSDPWIPKDKDVIKRYEAKLEQSNLDFNKVKTGVTVEERMVAERAANEKKFNNFFKRRSSLLMKYQYWRYLGKKFKIPKRFLINGKKFYEVMEIIQPVVDSIPRVNEGEVNDEKWKFYKDRLEAVSDKIYDFMESVEQMMAEMHEWSSEYSFEICSFYGPDSIMNCEKTFNIKLWPKYSSVYNPPSREEYHCERYEYSNKDFKKNRNLERYVAGLNGSMEYNFIPQSVFRALCFYELCKQADNVYVYQLRDFFCDMGFLPPEETEEVKEADGGEQKS